MRVINLFGGPGAGKCFRKGTEVILYDGNIIKVEDVKVGDELLGPDGECRIVLSLSSGRSELFEINPVKGDTFYVNSQHVLPLKFKHHKSEEDYKYTVKDYLELSEWRKGRLKLYRSDCLGFNFNAVPIDPYFIGCWLGDGTNANQDITNMDDDIINYLEELANTFGMKLTKVDKEGTEAKRCSISNGNIGGKPNTVLDILRELNLINNKHIPYIYKINDVDSRLDLLAGLIDTDGSLTRNCYEIITKYSKLRDDILFVSRSLGLAAYCSDKYIDGNVYYRITISGDTDIIPVRIKYKKASKRKQVKNVLRTGFKVKSIGTDNFYGFEVDRDHLFLLSDFTVVHNSTTAAGLFFLMKSDNSFDNSVELVTEFAKDLNYAERFKELEGNNQLYITSKQHNKLHRLRDQVDYAITDSPIIQSLMYTPENYFSSFGPFLRELFDSFDNINIFIKRVKPYKTYGRSQTEEQADNIGMRIANFLHNNGIEYHSVNGDAQAPYAILDLITEKEI